MSKEQINSDYLSPQFRQVIPEETQFKDEITAKKVTCFFRPDDRTDKSHSLYLKSNSKELSFIGLLEKKGSHKMQIPPKISLWLPVKITKREACQIENIPQEILKKGLNCQKTHLELLEYLKEKYPEKDEFTLNSILTIYHIKYLH